MARIITDSKHYADIASTLRNVGDSAKTYKPEQMADGILEVADKQFQEGKKAGYTVRTGTFTPEEDTSKIHLQIPSHAKMVELIPLGTPGTATSATYAPVHYVQASFQFLENNAGYKNLGTLVQYCYASRYYTSYYAYDVSNGFDLEMASSLVFEANMPYKWIAHYW